ncbi:hypothetical protein FRC12_019820 [Ceratobasidium sp. 428]|nr:hypothetical protein FRC12_019820 [Ceratobasidium sp. 428]
MGMQNDTISWATYMRRSILNNFRIAFFTDKHISELGVSGLILLLTTVETTIIELYRIACPVTAAAHTMILSDVISSAYIP